MKIKMIRSHTGSNDGMHVELYQKDQEYNLTDGLANIFINELKVAVKADEIESEVKAVNNYVNKSVEPEIKKEEIKTEIKQEKEDKKKKKK